MSNQLQPTQQIQSPTLTLDQQAHINKLLEQSKSSNTVDAYQSDWKLFIDFCTVHNQTALPAHTDTILLYIAELSKTHKHSTIKRKLSSINKAHKTADFPSPTYNSLVKDLMDGVARTIGNKQTPKKAITLDTLKLMIDAIDLATLAGKRDKALILLGFSVASRRSELVAIDTTDITYTAEGMDVQIFEEKNQVYITKSVLNANNDYCPVASIQKWIEVAQISNNAVFRSIDQHGNIRERLSDQTVADLVKKYIKAAGLNPSEYAGHSLRSGLATSAAEQGFSDSAIQKQTGHSTREMVSRYVQTGNRFKNNVTSILGKISE